MNSDVNPLNTYFLQYDHVTPPSVMASKKTIERVWHVLAGVTIGLALIYIQWRWSYSLNLENYAFSIMVATAESCTLFGTILIYFDIWSDGESQFVDAHTVSQERTFEADVPTSVDIFITTYDEGPNVIKYTLEDASKVIAPEHVDVRLYILDDGNQPGMRRLCDEYGASYFSRESNVGFKAGNLRNALMQTSGAFIVICDADTRLFTTFLTNTLPYFQDPNVAWVQTPHWFYDIPGLTNRLVDSPKSTSNWNNHLGNLADKALSFLRLRDPFSSNPEVFFDVIQRRRSRNNASFCCGAGSIHRRAAIMEGLRISSMNSRRRTSNPFAQKPGTVSTFLSSEEPFVFHVSEDILTSIRLHNLGWKSVYHPKIEAKMLSPWSSRAWAMQKWKYSGGTFDIMLRHNPIFRSGMPWKTKLHYLATFYSYLSVLWVSVLCVAPVLSMLFSWSPVSAYSIEFFSYLLPVLVLNELTMYLGCRGYNTHRGRAMSLATLPIQLHAACQVLKGNSPKFPTTPKAPESNVEWKVAIPILSILLFYISSLIWGFVATYLHLEGYSWSLFVVNAFWICTILIVFLRATCMLFWKPEFEISKISAAHS